MRVAYAVAAIHAGPALAGPSAPPELVKVGVYTVAPFILTGNERAEGTLIDFFNREVAPRMGVRFQWERPVTVARLEKGLASGQVLFTPILARTPERDAAGILFDTESYVKFMPCVVVLPTHPLNAIRSANDLADMHIGWMQAGALPPFMRDPRIQLDLIGGVDWEQINLAKLRLGRIGGAYFSNCASAQYYAARDGMPLKLLPMPVPGVALFGAFSPHASPDLVRRYHKAARQAFANGRFEAFMSKALSELKP